MKNLYLIIGKSGCGKSAIVDLYCKKYGTTQVLSYTTRPVRASEMLKPTHTHLSVDEFDKLKDSMVAYTLYNGYEYGVTQSMCEQADFYVIDKNGIDYFKGKCKNIPFKIIKIEVIDSILYSRLCIRDGKQKALERMAHDKNIDYDIEYDCIVDNNRECNLEGVVNQLHEYIQNMEKEN